MIKDPYIKQDLCGYAFNSKFPPSYFNNKNDLYHGYRTPSQECLFYDFAVQGYDLMIKYHGKFYYFMVDKDCVWLSDNKFTATLQQFQNGNDVLLNFHIEGKPLYTLVDKLDQYEAM